MSAGKLKFLADVNIEEPIVALLRTKGFDVKWVPEFNPVLDDAALLRIAQTEKRILLTNDKDFGELIFLHARENGTVPFFRKKYHNILNLTKR